MNKNGRTLVFYREIENLLVHVAKGSCRNLSKCIILIADYKSHLSENNVVVVYPRILIVNSDDPKLMKKFESGSWGIIFSGTYWNTYEDYKKLMKKFGICSIKFQINSEAQINLNWCEKVSQTTEGIFQ